MRYGKKTAGVGLPHFMTKYSQHMFPSPSLRKVRKPHFLAHLLTHTNSEQVNKNTIKREVEKLTKFTTESTNIFRWDLQLLCIFQIELWLNFWVKATIH